ncbi:MAG: hypothetical protein MSG64_14630 [Pyrinomonadaceae bacterium MAG19_C2-C3]|nr:hypothetical protein [Pyrinomonadaceae bacterium MAG19_C2-C3]
MKTINLLRTELLRPVMFGLLIAALLTPVTSVRAFPVYDAINHGTQIEKMIEEASRWVATVNQYKAQIEKYSKMVENQVKQIESLGGILNTVDTELARHRQLVSTVASLGRTVRDSMQLRDQIQRMITCRIQAVKRMYDRLQNGIFDADQNKRDLDEYLTHTIGRSSERVIAHQEALARMDTEYNDAHYRLEIANLRLANIAKRRIDLKLKLEEEIAKGAGNEQAVQEINRLIAECDTQSELVMKEISDMKKIIAEKIEKYGVVIDDGLKFAKKVQGDIEWFRQMTDLNDEVEKTLDEIFDPATEVKIDPPDEDFYLPFNHR